MVEYSHQQLIERLRRELGSKRKFFLGKGRFGIYGNSKILRLNRNFIKHRRYWIRRLKNRKHLLKFNQIYIRSKSRQIYEIMRKYKHYILTFKAFASNFYIMLIDFQGNVLLSCSTGQVSHSRSKKKKNSMMLVYAMMQKVKHKLMKHRIKHLVIHIRTDISSKIISAIRFLNYSTLKFKVTYIALLKPVPHHFGRRKKKPRRI